MYVEASSASTSRLSAMALTSYACCCIHNCPPSTLSSSSIACCFLGLSSTRGISLLDISTV
jgi:hypothetical protein